VTSSGSNVTARAAEALSRPLTLGRTTVRNRIVMAPMTRQFSPGGVPGENVADYYARRAAADVGLIVTEGTYVGHDAAGSSADVPRFHGEDALAGWARVVERVHAAGGHIVPQLWHVGMTRAAGAPPVPQAPPSGPSGIDLKGAATGHAMTLDDIDDVIRAFAQGAADAERAGFDGVELHGAHGYLIDQFLWSGTNRRTDGYGGSLAARARFATEVTAAVRKAVSPDFPVIFRLSQWKSDNYDARLAETPDELGALLGALADAGADVFHASTRRYWLPEFDGSELNLAGWAKKLTGKPAITVGSVGLDEDFIKGFMGVSAAATGLDALVERLENDEFDLVAVGRALLADPEWAAKVLAGRTEGFVRFEPAALKTLH
jgi:2,4-dienoyl-CoA reductase-like NADH-dependent reductase (Old Yellow Enzyme family)